jgi:hypothetical protein
MSLVTLRFPAATRRLLVDPRGAIGAARLFLDGADLLEQLGVGTSLCDGTPLRHS